MAKSTISMRVDSADDTLICKAASILRTDRTAFMVEAARREALNVLLDQRYFLLSDQSFAEFQAQLLAPVNRNETLATLLKEKSPWEN